ncbi:MAG: HAMP domain-containing protein [Proteobacteria bacterium]|nr:HAMP domain-containing protein [Pseudomonadota bacterium]MBU1649146.1 HAMP domain-containing protein [Pseudomonadota bacterium]
MDRLAQNSPQPDPTSEKPALNPAQRLQKRRLIRLVILSCLCLIPLLTWLEKNLFTNDITLPINSNILLFGIINLNVLLALLMFFLVLRNLAELLFESRQKFLGFKLKTKLVTSFICLSLVPSALLFFVALQFISTSMDYWFNTNIENSLQESLELAKSVLQERKEQVTKESDFIEKLLSREAITPDDAEAIQKMLENIITSHFTDGPDSLTLITDDLHLEITASMPVLTGQTLPTIPLSTLHEAQSKKEKIVLVQEFAQGDLIRCVAEIPIVHLPSQKSILVTTRFIKSEQKERMTLITQGIEDYRQLKYMKKPFKFWLLALLLIVTLLIVFAAIWFGFYIAKGITGPIDKLAAATRRVAGGDLGFVLEKKADDEMGLLVDSFNTMTTNLNISNSRLEEVHKALRTSSQESEQRRRYTEIILQNVAAGVVSLDNSGRITTINRFAEKLLHINKALFLNRHYQEALLKGHAEIISGFINELNITGKTSIEQHLKLSILKEKFSLLVNFTRLADEEGNSLGFVMVFDNLTKLEKMQRMAAWREVARRIAHEIKNPLTPIQLSAQRLRRRYPDILKEEDGIFDQCTHTIINQVDELKRLVSEFSQFARMPKIQQAAADLCKVTKETLFLYQEAHKEIVFTCRETEPIPIFSFDAEQIKRCLINLLDNAVAVLSDGGTIDIVLSLNDEKESVFIKISDSGPGIPEEDKTKLFEPYFSTKKTGTGLGLAIVSTIVADHNGYIRVQNNLPHGSIFIIELPLFQKECS